MKFLRSVDGMQVTTQFGDVDSVHLHPHKGIDLAMSQGQDVHSFADGMVTSAGNEGLLGNAVHIKMSDGTEMIYGHLSKINVKVGDAVYDDQVIGAAGSTGHSTGPHLHYQVMQNGQAVDPSNFIHVQDPMMLHPISEILRRKIEAGAQWATDKTVNTVTDWLCQLGHLLNQNSAEITTLCIVVCGFCIMVSPITGMNTSKWYGRLVGSFILGSTWRVILHANS